MKRLTFSAILAAALLCGAAAQAQSQSQTQSQTPIVFVHGNGDDATKWLPVIWMFESNGYRTDRLFAIRFTDPAARRDDTVPEPFRSSTTDQASELSAFVTRVLLETKSRKVALVGSSRGGLTIRNYVKNAGGAAVVSHVVLCGTPNHGVMAMDTGLDGEFNGRGHFLHDLNQGSEVVEGVKFLTVRSDKFDKYAQAAVGFDGPELKGAENVVIPNLDHRETAFHPAAFAQMYRFLTGQAPQQPKAVAAAAVNTSGIVTGFAGAAPTNRPLAGVHFRVFALQPGSANREDAALLDLTTAESGAWGPLPVRPDSGYEFVLEKDGHSVSYFMSGLLRSTNLLNFRFLPAAAIQALGGSAPAGPSLLVHRPQGYFSKGRDPLTLDGVAVDEVPPGVPTRDMIAIPIPAAKKAGVRVELRGEVVHARPAENESQLNVVELIWE